MNSFKLSSLRASINATGLAISAAVLILAACLGYSASLRWLALFVVGIGAVVVLQQPLLGVVALVPVALVIPIEVGTGTAVVINPATLLVPALLAVWILDMVRRRDLHLAPSRTNRPLQLFLLAGLFSLLVGRVLWDPAIPLPGNFTLVQLAQWFVFAFSAGAFWLTGNLVRREVWLQRLTFLYLALAGSLAILYVLPGGLVLVDRTAREIGVEHAIALIRAPFWLMLAALGGGQLLFNRELAAGWRLYVLVVMGAVFVFVFHLGRATTSHWVGVVAAMGVLAWLRWPRMRWPVVILLVVLAVTGFLSAAVYEFAGGDEEWNSSGGSRLVLIGRVIEVTMRNPITGLGPAAYRPYARMKPLPYGRAFWSEPSVSSHNNYVDLFSHVGLLGLGLFAWFVIEVTRLGLELRSRFTSGFSAGYVNAMLAMGAGSLILMLFADWILPFVYNIGFPGFQASVLVWLFLGGVVFFEQIKGSE